MALGISADVREIVSRACARNDVLAACRRRDLGTVIAVLNAQGVTQGMLAELTGIPQGRLSQYKTGKHTPRAASIFQQFADGVGMPSTARQALGLAPALSLTASIDAQQAALPAAVGLRYPETPAETAGNLAVLWQSDLSEVRALRDQIEPGAWGDASLRWLLATSHQQVSGTTAGVRIGMADVDRFRTTVQMFEQLDDRFGGGHAREALIQYLRTDAERLLRGRYSESVGKALFSATAEAALLAAWMSYDSMPESALAQNISFRRSP
jgi:Helix-turn-helix